MPMRTETKTVEQEIAIYFCDLCDTRLGPAPVDKNGGYFMACSLAASDDKRPLWFGTFCRSCIDDLRKRTGFDGR